MNREPGDWKGKSSSPGFLVLVLCVCLVHLQGIGEVGRPPPSLHHMQRTGFEFQESVRFIYSLFYFILLKSWGPECGEQLPRDEIQFTRCH